MNKKARKGSNDRDNVDDATDDPFQYHAKPRDFSKQALAQPHSINPNTFDKSLFTKSKFNELGLDSKLSNILHGDEDEGGLGLETSTTTQSLAIPSLLKQRKNILIKSQTGFIQSLYSIIVIFYIFIR